MLLQFPGTPVKGGSRRGMWMNWKVHNPLPTPPPHHMHTEKDIRTHGHTHGKRRGTNSQTREWVPEGLYAKSKESTTTCRTMPSICRGCKSAMHVHRVCSDSLQPHGPKTDRECVGKRRESRRMVASLFHIPATQASSRQQESALLLKLMPARECNDPQANSCQQESAGKLHSQALSRHKTAETCMHDCSHSAY